MNKHEPYLGCFDPSRVPTYIQPVTAREGDDQLLLKSWWQVADQNGVRISGHRFRPSPAKAHQELCKAKKEWSDLNGP